VTVLDLLTEQLPDLVTRRRLLQLGVSESDVDRIWRLVLDGLHRPAGSRNTYAPKADVLAAWEKVAAR
jgi:hypothetical protein